MVRLFETGYVSQVGKILVKFRRPPTLRNKAFEVESKLLKETRYLIIIVLTLYARRNIFHTKWILELLFLNVEKICANFIFSKTDV